MHRPWLKTKHLHPVSGTTLLHHGEDCVLQIPAGYGAMKSYAPAVRSCCQIGASDLFDARMPCKSEHCSLCVKLPRLEGSRSQQSLLLCFAETGRERSLDQDHCGLPECQALRCRSAVLPPPPPPPPTHTHPHAPAYAITAVHYVVPDHRRPVVQRSLTKHPHHYPCEAQVCAILWVRVACVCRGA